MSTKLTAYWLSCCLVLLLSGCRGLRYPSFRIGWDTNIKVLASSDEEKLSFVGLYTSALVTQAKQTSIPSLEAAQEQLMQDGIRYNQLKLYPTATNRKQDSWYKADHQKMRFALLLGGPAYENTVNLNGVPLGPQRNFSSMELDQLESLLKDPKEYGLTNGQILKKAPVSSGDVAEGILWLADKLKRYPNAEGLIMLCSHGSEESSYFRMPWDGEGDAQGTLYMADGPLKEETLKNWINAQLGNRKLGANAPPVLIIVLACRAGAFTA